MWDLSCPDWRNRIRQGQSLIPDGLPLDQKEAERAVTAFNMLRIPDVPGMPTMEHAAGDWFRDIVRAGFGCMVHGQRMIREIFTLVPKKNSKTTGGAAVMVTALLLNERPRAEFLLIAPTKDIAQLSFAQAVGMIEADSDLVKLFYIQNHIKKITYRPTKAALQIKAFDSSVLTGVKPVGVLVDELHEIAKDGQAERIMGQVRGGILPNPEGFIIYITTQSDEPPRGIFEQELKRARAVRDGKATGRVLPILYEFPEDMMIGERGHEPWRNPENWWMVTPNRGKSITVERLIEDFNDAKLKGEQEVLRWASQHLNLEIGLGLRSDRWTGADDWLSATDPGLSLNEILKRCEVCTVGVDGGGKDDWLGLAIIGRERGTRRWLHWAHAWAFKSALEARKSEASRWADFSADGDLSIVDFPGRDVDEIVQIIVDVDRAGVLGPIGFDPAGVGAIVDALAEVGIEGDESIVGISQGYKLMGSIKTVERKLLDRTFVHSGSRMMSYAVSNARTELKGNAVMITKAVSGVGKIDPLMATFNAAALMGMNPDAISSVYETRGLRVG